MFPHPGRAQPVRRTVRNKRDIITERYATCANYTLDQRFLTGYFHLTVFYDHNQSMFWVVTNPLEQKSSLTIQDVHEPNSRWRHLSLDMSNHKSILIH